MTRVIEVIILVGCIATAAFIIVCAIKKDSSNKK